MTKLRQLTVDPQKTASSAHLVYVKDNDPGIRRIRHGKSFRYLKDNGKVNARDLHRIKRLVIPPAWSNVWICKEENGHIQCTGFDVSGRKQYRYHAEWVKVRSETKYHRMLQFGEALPAIREQVQKDISCNELNERKVLATVISLMEQTCIRIGNSSYERLYGSFGLTTLKDQHVKINGHTLAFSFKGKKGVRHSISIKNRKLAKIVKQCRDIPGKELFQYKDEHGEFRSIDSGMINNYIKSCCDDNFTAKDFRTWAGSLHAMKALFNAGTPISQADARRKVVDAIDQVSSLLGNTRAVCKKYYVHPAVIDAFENNTLSDFFEGRKISSKEKLTGDECILMKLFRSKAARRKSRQA